MAGNKYYSGPKSDHFDGRLFFNPGQTSTDRSLGELLRWQFSGGRESWTGPVPARPSAKPPLRSAALRVTMVGHASVLIQTAGCNLLVDPVWSDRASPLRWAGPKRANAPGIALADLPPVDAVLITHSHYDHLDLVTLAQLWRTHRMRVVAPLGMDKLIARSVPSSAIVTGDWGATIALGGEVEIHIVAANHWSARSLGDRRMALWCGFVIRSQAGIVYHVGDTGYGDGRIFVRLRERFGAPDLAIVPIGAYEPRWFMQAQHVNPEEAVRILLECGARQAVGVHWGTFQLTDEPRTAPREALAEALAQAGIPGERFLALEPGDFWLDPNREAKNSCSAIADSI